MRSHHVARFGAVALLLGSMGVAACGGDDAGSPAVTADLAAAPTTPAPTTAARTTVLLSTGQPDGVVSYSGLSQDHSTDDVVYEQTPPVGGPHDPSWESCGFYGTEIREEMGVHSMEHGAVWITFAPNLPASDVAVLTAVVAGHPYLLVSPYEGLPAPVVASAWGEQLLLESVSDPRLAQFVEFFEEGPQTPELGAPC